MSLKQQPMGIGWKREGDHVVGHVVAVEPDGSRNEVATVTYTRGQALHNANQLLAAINGVAA